jgi:thiamine-monophosphate kinase
VTVNVSDVAAMGGSPRFALVSLALSDDVSAAWVMELYGGMRQAGEEHGLVLVGGDTSRSDRVVIAVTVYGEVGKGKAVTRSGARPGDRLVVTGSLGASAGGLRIAGDPGARSALSTEWGRDLLATHERPHARVGEGQTLAAAGATAMLDISDGLAVDAGHLARRSGVRVIVDLESVPRAGELEDLGFGEDFELLAATRDPLDFPVIGRCEAGEGVELLLEGRPVELPGWEHFR